MRPSNKELIESYMQDLLNEPACQEELAQLQYAIDNGITIGVDRYGIPSVQAGKQAEKEALQLILACLKIAP